MVEASYCAIAALFLGMAGPAAVGDVTAGSAAAALLSFAPPGHHGHRREKEAAYSGQVVRIEFLTARLERRPVRRLEALIAFNGTDVELEMEMQRNDRIISRLEGAVARSRP